MTTDNRTPLGLELEAAAREILTHVRGEKSLPVELVEIPNEDEPEAS